uniref:DNA helicase related protein n=1 Tax=uncultured bacterium UPO78 TaxID=1776995 RepID=A0A140E028_9BACT|nr:hypothetical protein [uncultured bacterium UPO78]
MTQANILRFWHAVELLNPQDVPALDKLRASDFHPFAQELVVRGVTKVPWSRGTALDAQALPVKREWSHRIYARCYDLTKAIKELEAKFGATQGYAEPKSQKVALYSVKFNHQGKWVDDSLVLSSAAWMLGCVLAGRSFLTGFGDAQNRVIQIAAEELSGTVDSVVIERLTGRIAEELGLSGFFSDVQNSYVCLSSVVKPGSTETEDDPLNSFILEDLSNISTALSRGESSPALNAYLQKHSEAGRFSISDDHNSEELIKLMAPNRYPAGCWPAPKDQGLVHSQQLAVNVVLKQLQAGEGLLSVNGPPGTGKTTLLRDIVAAVVTTRADALARLGTPSAAFTSRGEVQDAGSSLKYWHLHDSLLGHEIVVASSNNGAIENVTKELPQLDKVDASWLADYDYFAGLSGLVSDQPSWGLISAALGKKANRKRFIDRFWFGQESKSSKEGVSDDDFDDVESPEGSIAEPTPAPNAQTTSSAADASAVEERPSVTGMMAWLNAQPRMKWFSSGASSEEKAEAREWNAKQTSIKEDAWRVAVKRYLEVRSEADRIGAVASTVTGLVEAMCSVRESLAKLRSSETGAQQILDASQARVTALVAQLGRAQALLGEMLAEHAELLRGRPGFWANLLSFWGASRRWKALEYNLVKRMEVAGSQCKLSKREIEISDREVELHRKMYASAKEDTLAAETKLQQLKDQLMALADKYKAHHLQVFLDTGAIGRGDAIELAEPWSVPGWRRARSKVFLEALRLHKTLFELEPEKMWTNLNHAVSLLKGNRYNGVPAGATRSVWATLFMVVPAMSSTFSSFQRCFSTLGASEIGWLLVDEAGQATPQAAVGALWRSRRAVMVGDPLQLEPINKVPVAALEHMRNAYNVASHWMPSSLSAQRLADEANPIGRQLGPEGEKVWVGLPLVVHRRCDRPMFETANRIAYDGAMVYGTIAPDPDTLSSLPSGWLDVRGDSEGNWVPAEGKVLDILLAYLTDLEGVSAASISVITPFTDVKQGIGNKFRRRGGGAGGTIHTMQGKEAEIVVLVLGGNADPNSTGARDWVVAKPNMLNVAATRGKRRFYVIGDRASWASRRYFDVVMDLLPSLDLSGAVTRAQEKLTANAAAPNQSVEVELAQAKAHDFGFN